MDSSHLLRLQLTYTIQSSSYRKETLMGVDYEVFGIISNYGDTVVWPGNAPGPCLIPKSALINLADLRNGRYVVVNHPTYFGQDVPSTFNKAVIEAHTIGSWFNNYYDGVKNCIRGEIWIDPVRAGEVTGAQEILDRLRSGEKVGISESNVCFSDPTPGELNGQHYDEILLIMVPEHIAVLPKGWVGACSIEGGCAAGINMSRNMNQITSKGVPMTISQTAKWIFRGLQGNRIERNELMDQAKNPERRNQILATDIWALLYAALLAKEPAFFDLRDYDPDKGLVFYCTRIIMGDRYDGKVEIELYMRSYSITAGVVTLGDDVVEVMETRTYEKVETVNQVNQAGTVPVVMNDDGTVTVETVNETNNPPCGCKGEQMSETNPKPTETPVVTPAAVEPNQAPATTSNVPPATTSNVPATETNPATTTTATTAAAPATTVVNEQSGAAGAADWWANVPPEVRTVLQGIASQESARFEQLVKVAVNQGLPESAARKLSSTELTTVLEKFGIQSRPGQPVTAPLTNEAGGTKQRPSPWSNAGSKVATGASGKAN